MNTTRHRTVRALANAMVGFIRIAPKKALAAQAPEELSLADRLDRALELLLWNLRPVRSPEELAHHYAATYTDESEGEPIR